MITLSAGQFAAFDQIETQRFYESAASYLRDNLPEATEDFTPIELVDHVADCHQIANWLGIESETGIVKVACLSFGPQPEFYQTPEIYSYITEPGAYPEGRLDTVVEALESASGTM
ncbi:hypothetical protein [Marinobacter sp.]|uniref:hypothetical protein n=1 Tax=Marinobacter sp. TaxID=50741 RepID=UPI002B480E1D|nr:hypothetical protein [Marinobacter sp.]HKK54920.1 hypothetical protein [Marinobacter sp.]